MYRNLSVKTLAVITAFTVLKPVTAFACACGCGVFDVGTSTMLPNGTGGMAWIEYDFMNQDKNWHGTSSAAGADNSDKDIKTDFLTAGAQYMFNRDWGAEVEVPYWFRHFTTTDDSGDVQSFNHEALGDIRVKGIYSGFSGDMSTGITFGLKLPTGDYSYTNFDRDTEIGSGSTDMLLGVYHMGNLAGSFNWFANAQWDQPFLTRDQYRPGAEVDAAIGAYYNGWNVGSVKIAPLAEVLNSYRLNDRGLAADPQDSGYERVLLAPGIEVDTGGWRVYGDVEVPVYQHIRGEQLTAGELFKLNISHSF
jgi:hypothetical protein